MVKLISSLAHAQADCDAAQRQAESASAAARQFMEDKENKVQLCSSYEQIQLLVACCQV